MKVPFCLCCLILFPFVLATGHVRDCYERGPFQLNPSQIWSARSTIFKGVGLKTYTLERA